MHDVTARRVEVDTANILWAHAPAAMLVLDANGLITR
jgi:hypothetical protein